jgi:hypothetical protein
VTSFENLIGDRDHPKFPGHPSTMKAMMLRGDWRSRRTPFLSLTLTRFRPHGRVMNPEQPTTTHLPACPANRNRPRRTDCSDGESSFRPQRGYVLASPATTQFRLLIRERIPPHRSPCPKSALPLTWSAPRPSMTGCAYPMRRITKRWPTATRSSFVS